MLETENSNHDNIVAFRKKETFCEVVKQPEPRFTVQEHEGMFYILDRYWPNLVAGNKEILHCSNRQHAEDFCSNINKRPERRAFHVSEISDEDLEAIRNAKMPTEYEHLNELLDNDDESK